MTKQMTVSGPGMSSRKEDASKPYLVAVRDGDLIEHHKFPDLKEATTFATGAKKEARRVNKERKKKS